MSDETPDTPMSRQEQAALALYHQLVNLSPDDGDIFLRLTVRLGNGRLIGDVVLSSNDTSELTEAVVNLREHREMFGDLAGPLPIAEGDITDALVDGMAAEFEEFLKSEDGQP